MNNDTRASAELKGMAQEVSPEAEELASNAVSNDDLGGEGSDRAQHEAEVVEGGEGTSSERPSQA